MNIPRTVAQLTAHPRLFAGVYWGNFGLDDAVGTPEIIENRNRLVDDFQLITNITLRWDYPATPDGTEFDHPEVYRVAGGKVLLLVSNYGGTPPPPSLGMVAIYPVYRANATSFARVFDRPRDLKATIMGGKGTSP